MSVTPILTRALRYGGILALVIALVAGVLGLIFAGVPGLIGGLLGAVFAAVFTGLTAASMLVAGRVAKGDTTSPTFLGIVLGVGFLKIVLFLVAVLALRDQPWLDPLVFFLALVVSVMGSLITDVLAFQRARVPYVSDVVLPGETKPSAGPRDGAS
jgi:drug/metabolite transporter (DMT)-like permease